jgi:hypothetical protein
MPHQTSPTGNDGNDIGEEIAINFIHPDKFMKDLNPRDFLKLTIAKLVIFREF